MALATSFPNSAFSYGFGEDVVTGTRIYVDSGATIASDGNLGVKPNQPMATLNGALNRVAANNGDYIYLMPGHAETISADAATDPGPDMTVAGVTVVGLGEGSDRPSFTFDATAADFKLNAANCKVHNVLFLAGVASQVMMIEVSGDDCEMSHCEFRNTSAFEGLIAVNIGIASNDADRFYIHDCRFISDTAGSTSAVSMTALQAGVRIENNYLRGDYSDSGIQSAVIHTDCVVKNNFVQNDNAGEHAIQFSTTSTGIIQDNTLVNDVYSLAIDPGSCAMAGNRWLDPAVDTGDIPFPAVGLDAVTAGALPLVSFTGERFFVDSGHADASDTAGYGTSPASPFLTLDFANTQCTSANGDVIYAMPGHVDTVTNGTDLNFDVIGVTAIGLGTGRNRPLIDFTTADTADAPVSVANVLLKNLRFDASTFDSNTAMITITGADVTIEDCEFVMGDGSQQTDSCITTNSARTRVINCNFIGTTTEGVEDAIEITGTPDGIEIIGNKITGDFTNACIQSASVHTNCVVRDNLLQNTNTGEHAIQFSDAATGWIIDNKFVTDAHLTTLDKGSCKVHGNIWWDDADVAADVSGVPFPPNADYNPLLGYHVSAADAVTPQGTTTTLFTIVTGRVLVTKLTGQVGTIIATASNIIRSDHVPTVGSTVALFANLELNAFNAGTFLHAQLDGTALVGTDGESTMLGIAAENGIPNCELDVGVIDWTSGQSASGTVKWDLWYWPIEDGAHVLGS